MMPYERKSRIIEYLEQHGKAEVNELSAMLGVVAETIRRDLREFERQDLVSRTHGGAVLKHPRTVESPVQIRVMKNSVEKERICRRAARLVADGDLVFVDNSSTLIHLVRYIDDKLRLTMLTNSMQVLQEYAGLHQDHITMICSGGLFNKTNLSFSGTIAGSHVYDLYPAKAFVSCHGVSAEVGFTDGNFLEVGFKREMIERAAKVHFLLDHTKFNRVGPIRIGDLGICDVLVTDSKPPGEVLEPLYQANPELELIIAD